jgi:thiamine-monophosphate kinase
VDEFALIAQYFGRAPRRAALGVGDDAALWPLDGQRALAITSDMLLQGRHFLPDTDPERLGHKALAVNLSDLAAMGARPCGYTLALALPEVNEAWLAAFARGLHRLADAHGCELVGGDTTRGPCTLALTAWGEVPTAEALRRDRGRAGDDLWVSGELGMAALGLALQQNNNGSALLAHAAALDAATQARAIDAHETPVPRVALGLALRGIASAAMDISDGLSGDLLHLTRASGVGAQVWADRLPGHAALAALPVAQRRALQLAGGDDYELLFAAPAHQRPRVAQLAQSLGLTLTRIGALTPSTAVQWLDHAQQPLTEVPCGFNHFASP